MLALTSRFIVIMTLSLTISCDVSHKTQKHPGVESAPSPAPVADPQGHEDEPQDHEDDVNLSKPSIQFFEASTYKLVLRGDAASESMLVNWSSDGDLCTLIKSKPESIHTLPAQGRSHKIPISESTHLSLSCSNSAGQSQERTLFVEVERVQRGRQICNDILIKPAQGPTASIYAFTSDKVLASALNETIVQRVDSQPSGEFQLIRWNGSMARVKTADIMDSCDQTQSILQGLLILADGEFTNNYHSGTQSCPVKAGTIIDYESYLNGRSGFYTEITSKKPLSGCNFSKGYLPSMTNLHIYYYEGYPTAGAVKIKEIRNRLQISSFSVTHTSFQILEGKEELLEVSWESVNTHGCLIKRSNPLLQLELAAKGKVKIAISETTDLKLECHGAQGSVQSQVLNVLVNRPVPEINSFSSSPPNFYEQDTQTAINFFWDAKYADNCILTQMHPLNSYEVEAKGSMSLAFTLETTVTLQCKRGSLVSKTQEIAIVKQQNSAENGTINSSDQLRCYPGSRFQPQNKESNLLIGREGYGFNELDVCKKSISASRNNLVCNWNGSSYEAYRITDGRSAGKEGYGYSLLDGCTESVIASRFGVFCAWTGGSYSPYASNTNQTIGENDRGFTTYETCKAAVTNIKSMVLCNWNGSNYSHYSISKGTAIGRKGYGYTEFGTCQETVARSKNSYICNWNGDGYAIYHTATNAQFGNIWNSLDSCLKYLEEEI